MPTLVNVVISVKGQAAQGDHSRNGTKYASKLKWGLFWLFVLQLIVGPILWVALYHGLIDSAAKQLWLAYVPIWTDLIVPIAIALTLIGGTIITRSKVFVSKNALILLTMSILTFAINIPIANFADTNATRFPCDQQCDF